MLLIKNVLKPLAKSVLVSLGLIVAASLTDWGKKALLIQSVSETVTNEAKEQKFGFPTKLLGTLVATSLGNLLTANRIEAKILGQGLMRAGEETSRAG